MLKLVEEYNEKSSCAYYLKLKNERRMMIRLRSGPDCPLQIETGRWCRVRREKRIVKKCKSEEVDDVCHWLMTCERWDGPKHQFLLQSVKEGPQEIADECKTCTALI
jgi:hypothetical protein